MVDIGLKSVAEAEQAVAKLQSLYSKMRSQLLNLDNKTGEQLIPYQGEGKEEMTRLLGLFMKEANHQVDVRHRLAEIAKNYVASATAADKGAGNALRSLH